MPWRLPLVMVRPSSTRKVRRDGEKAALSRSGELPGAVAVHREVERPMVQRKPALWLCGLVLGIVGLPGCQCSLCGSKHGGMGSGFGTSHAAASGSPASNAGTASVQGWNSRSPQNTGSGVPVSTPVATGQAQGTMSRTATNPYVPASAPAASVKTQPQPVTPVGNSVLGERRTMDRQVTPAMHLQPVTKTPDAELDARPTIDPPSPPQEDPQALRRTKHSQSEPAAPPPPQLEPVPHTTKVSDNPVQGMDPDSLPPPSLSLPKLPPPPIQD